MNLIYKLFWFIAFFLGGLLIWNRLFWFEYSSSAIEHMLRQNVEIRAEFEQASIFLDNQIAKTGRLPHRDSVECCEISTTENFLQNWRGTKAWEGSQFDKLGVSENASATDYILTKWRGEWFEAYASQTGNTTLAEKPSDFKGIKSTGYEFRRNHTLLILVPLLLILSFINLFRD